MIIVAVCAQDKIEVSRAASVGSDLFDIGSYFILISFIGGLSSRVIIPLARVDKRESAVALNENGVRVGGVEEMDPVVAVFVGEGLLLRRPRLAISVAERDHHYIEHKYRPHERHNDPCGYFFDAGLIHRSAP